MALEQRQAATGTVFGRARGKRRSLALRKWAKVSLRGGAQVASHENRLSFCSASLALLRFAPLGLSQCTETLGLPWQKNKKSFFFKYIFHFSISSKLSLTYR